MDFQAEQMLRNELGHGERLLWSGMPRQGLRLRPTDWFMVPASLLWGGFAIFWEYLAISGGAPVWFTTWGIPFVLVGLYLIAGRFFVDRHQRSRTYYGVTDQRVLILSGLINRQTKSIALRNLGDVTLNERSDRSGSITFGAPGTMHPLGWGGAWPGTGQKQVPTFDLIDDARRVYNVIQEAQRSERGGARSVDR